MNTGFLNRCKLLVSNRSRALLIGQALCLLVVAAIFVVSPFVALAGCGQQNQAQKQKQAILNVAQQTKNIQIMAIISSMSPKVSPTALNLSTLPLNGPFPTGATLDGSITITPYTQQLLQVGDWIMIKQTDATGATIAYPATLFGESNINGTTVLEAWPAETPDLLPSQQNLSKVVIPVGQKIFVTLQNFTAGVTTA